MIDPVINVAATEAAKAGGGVLSRLLGPTADEMGAQLQEWYRRKNVERVARRAEAKAGTGTAGSIPLRVAAEVFEKAQWADDQFVSEYLSGVLASSRTPGGKDDRGVTWTALVGRLSADQLRLHYIVYREIRRLGSGLDYDTLTEALNKPIVFNSTALVAAMGFPLSIASANRTLEAAYGLSAEDLTAGLSHGSAEFMNDKVGWGAYEYPKQDGPFIQLSGTTRGASLFLHAHGLGAEWASAILDPSIELHVEWEDGEAVPATNARLRESFKTTKP